MNQIEVTKTCMMISTVQVEKDPFISMVYAKIVSASRATRHMSLGLIVLSPIK